jgi:hypothetical protein
MSDIFRNPGGIILILAFLFNFFLSYPVMGTRFSRYRVSCIPFGIIFAKEGLSVNDGDNPDMSMAIDF